MAPFLSCLSLYVKLYAGKLKKEQQKPAIGEIPKPA